MTSANGSSKCPLKGGHVTGASRLLSGVSTFPGQDHNLTGSVQWQAQIPSVASVMGCPGSTCRGSLQMFKPTRWAWLPQPVVRS